MAAPLLTAIHEVTPTTAHIGDQLVYHVLVKYDASAELLPLTNANISNVFSTLSFNKGTRQTGREKQYQFTAKIVPFSVGTYTIPARDVSIKLAGKVTTVTLPELTIVVKSILTPTQNQVEDIKSAGTLSYPVGLVAGIGLVLVILVGGGVAFMLLRRRPEDAISEFVPSAIPIPLDEAALSKLRALALGDFDQLSAVLRVYLDQRFDVPALEMTTTEVVAALEKVCEAALLKRIFRVLHLCDLVKFAQFGPSEDDARIAIEKTEEIIRHFGPVPVMEGSNDIG
jgi:hypothetical protein